MGNGDFTLKSGVVLLFLVLFSLVGVGGADDGCPERSIDEMRSLLVEIPNYTKQGDVTYLRIDQGTSIGEVYETNYVLPYRSVLINLIKYNDANTASADISLYPAPTDGSDWKDTYFRGYRALEKTSTVTSSEYLDYTAELRLVNGCTVLRGYWHQKIRIYEPLVTLEEGKASLELVVGAIAPDALGPPAEGSKPTVINQTPEITETPPPASSKPRVILLANSIDYTLASGFIGYLEGRGLEVVRATSGDFESYKNEAFIVILGGPDAPEGVGTVVQGVLTISEGNAVRTQGRPGGVFKRIDQWRLGQKVYILAGIDRYATASAAETNRATIATEALQN